MSKQMSQKTRIKRGFQRILTTLAAHQVALVDAGLVVQPCMKPEGHDKKKKSQRYRVLVPSWLVLFKDVLRIPMHADV